MQGIVSAILGVVSWSERNAGVVGWMYPPWERTPCPFVLG